MISEFEARTAPEFIVDYAMEDAPIVQLHTGSYRQAYTLARRHAKRAGTAYLIAVIGGKQVAQWRFDHTGIGNYIQRSFDAA